MQFTYQHTSAASRIMLGGTTEFDREKKQYRATIITQRDPEIRFDAWADDPALAGLLCCAKWMGHDLAQR